MSSVDSEASHKQQTDAPREQQLFDLLDSYVNAINGQGEAPVDPPAEVIDAFPELSELLDCLDSLEGLALPPERDRPPSEVGLASEETLIYRSASNEHDAVDHALQAERGRASGAACVRRFGRYELFDEIGRGGMGVVYRARQTALDATVALKVVRASQFASADEIRRFYAEARAAAGLRHPNIVCVHDVGECLGQHFLTMDFVEGGSLADRLKQGPLPPREAAETLMVIARAVDYLHRHKIVHRDLKPSNIMLDGDGIPHVTDFGLAKVFEGDSTQTASGTIIGTPCYMSPEQAAGRVADISPRSDIYSLGAILYEMLTGRPPFSQENPIDTLLQVIESPPEPPRKRNPQIPHDLEAICLRCLEKDPQDRFATAEELACELDHFLKGEPVHLPPRSIADTFVRWARREPALASRLGVLSVAIVVVQSYFQLGGHEDLVEHLQVMGVLALWTAISFVCQRLLSREEWERSIPYLWAAADAVCYTAVLCLADGPLGPIVIGYPVLVVGAGLWNEVCLVWFMTAVTTVSYLFLVAMGYEAEPPWHYPIIFIVALIGTGFIVAFQVHRLRSLSRYFERRKN
jgi:serine/threonine-protein kinase